ncbi:uncharacterized protein EDB93DRAFT_406618 [Suillus bovinus]|uniref:uncharacterized protein n=1 Tax=Suillus bovinus TaxID=48563 RepID=UPI001B8703DE|nr:uncharacterized protein EDB93DRAFT_150232 [Suillus bovinus]XP_041307695.1 uncharacterized protein EDB93DRAFT_406618 [Suillus bovinus]KAG2128667.1 hypothetical protein EDB93DRAFT_150232 [Suillus bovinus]KAG2147801.1 hypothetical protein EDB93DRAFT_406618 [Suillus bovinus]
MSSTFLLFSELENDPTKPYDVQVVQFWRGEEEPRRPYPLHWAIYVETSPSIGNTYQIAGDSTNYAIDIRLNQPLENLEDLRGSCIVGKVNRKELDAMETLLPRVAIMRDLPCWNSHNWVEDALGYLRRCCCFSIVGEIKLSGLQDNMCWLLEEWPEIEDAVEFVGDANLACVQNNRRLWDSHQNFWRLHETWRLKCAEAVKDDNEECDSESG